MKYVQVGGFEQLICDVTKLRNLTSFLQTWFVSVHFVCKDPRKYLICHLINYIMEGQVFDKNSNRIYLLTYTDYRRRDTRWIFSSLIYNWYEPLRDSFWAVFVNAFCCKHGMYIIMSNWFLIRVKPG